MLYCKFIADKDKPSHNYDYPEEYMFWISLLLESYQYANT